MRDEPAGAGVGGEVAVGVGVCSARVVTGDCLDVTRAMASASVDLVFGSPPYGNARTYGLGFALTGDEWVAWAVERFEEQLRVCRGLVAWVVDGPTRRFRWDPLPVLLAAELHRRGACLRRPCVYRRSGIPGSGGPDWYRCDHEWVVCATASAGRLPWSDNTACGRPPVCAPGGAIAHRRADGSRLNRGASPAKAYRAPKLANPGSVIDCGAAGGGNIGDRFAHENEAPFPEALAERFVRSFCPPGGAVLDPFGGSGTTAKVALACGRNAISVDVRAEMSRLTELRLAALAAGLSGGATDGG